MVQLKTRYLILHLALWDLLTFFLTSDFCVFGLRIFGDFWGFLGIFGDFWGFLGKYVEARFSGFGHKDFSK